MSVIELFKEYENLSTLEKRDFHLMIDLEDKREELADTLKQIYKANGSPYFDVDWINKNILKKDV